MKDYWVYILAGHSRRLYVGMTNDLERRVREHRGGQGSAFTAKYHIHCLVHIERFSDVRDVIRREKVSKGWTRAKKLELIESSNAGWLDLAASLDSPLHEALPKR